MTSEITRQLRAVRHVALDLDGTVYNGATLLPATNPFLKLIADLDIGHTFLTNNPSKSTEDYLKHLRAFGLHATADNLYTSAQATIQFLRHMSPAPKILFILGTPSMCGEFSAAGFELVETPESVSQSATRNPQSAIPDAVVVGFDTTLTYPRLCRAAWWIKQGKPFIATNPDRVCPTDQPTVLVDCGSICAMLQTATGRAPDAVMGKPDPTMLRGILERHQLQPAQLAMVGDRLYTDMEMARRAGALGVLVLTGETTAPEAATSEIPALVVHDLAELGELLRSARSH
jgi:NagD protein